MHVAVYLINLDGSDDRLREASGQLESAGVTFERVAAFDGRGLRIEEFPDYDAKGARTYMGRPLRGGEIGCYLSHLECARRFLESDAPVCIVLEDDMKLQEGFAEGVEAVLGWLARSGEDWDIVNIGANRHKIYSRMFGFDAGGRHHQLTHAHYFPMTTTGLIWSRTGADAFLREHHRIFAPVDNYMRHWQTRRNRGWAVWPALVTTTGVDSVITPATGPRRQVGDRHPLYGLIKQRRLMLDKLIAWYHKRRRAARKPS